jgi:hypothetical protein
MLIQIASKVWLTHEWWIESDLEGSASGSLEALSWHLSGWTEENHEESQSEQPVFVRGSIQPHPEYQTKILHYANTLRNLGSHFKNIAKTEQKLHWSLEDVYFALFGMKLYIFVRFVSHITQHFLLRPISRDLDQGQHLVWPSHKAGFTAPTPPIRTK